MESSVNIITSNTTTATTSQRSVIVAEHSQILISGSPQIFPNATEFEVSGGTWVLGDVHNHHTDMSAAVRPL
jgi:hypothetical protein